MHRYKFFTIISLFLVLSSVSYGINPYLTRTIIEGRQTHVAAVDFRIPLWRWYGQIGGTGVFRLKFVNDDMSVGYFIIRGYQYQPAIYRLGLQHIYIVEELGGGRLSKVIHMKFDPLGDVDDFYNELTADHVTNEDLISTTNRIERYLITKNLTTLEFLKLIDAFSAVSGKDNLTAENINDFNSLYNKIFQDDDAITLLNRFNNSFKKDEIDLNEFLTLMDLVITYGNVDESGYLKILNYVNRELKTEFSRFDESPIFHKLIKNIVNTNLSNHDALGGISYKASHISMNIMGNVQSFSENYDGGKLTVDFTNLDNDNVYGFTTVKLPFSGTDEFYPDNLLMVDELNESVSKNENFKVVVDLPNEINEKAEYKIALQNGDEWQQLKHYKSNDAVPDDLSFQLKVNQEFRYGELTLERVWLGGFSMFWEDSRNWKPSYVPVDINFAVFDGRAEDDCLVSGNVQLKNMHIDRSFSYLIKNFD